MKAKTSFIWSDRTVELYTVTCVHTVSYTHLILFGINVFRGGEIGDAFMFAVALAVAAIPEALSSIVTIVLSFGTQKMAKELSLIHICI